MATKTAAEVPARTEERPLQLAATETSNRELEKLQDEVGSVVEMIDYFLTDVLRDEMNAQPAPNLIRGDVMEGALQMISGRLSMALGDY